MVAVKGTIRMDPNVFIPRLADAVPNTARQIHSKIRESRNTHLSRKCERITLDDARKVKQRPQ